MEEDVELTHEEMILLAFALEYDYNEKAHQKVTEILDKVENSIHIDVNDGRLYEYGRVMGWTKELDNGKLREDI